MKPERPKASRLIKARVTEREHETIKSEAKRYGYEISSLVRLRLLGRSENVRVTRLPDEDLAILSNIMGKLSALTGEFNKIGSNLNQIAKRLNQGSRDLFGLDSAVRLFEALGKKLTHALNHIEAAIEGRLKNHNEEE